MKKQSERQKFISSKIKRIYHEGLRGKAPAPGQAAAVAYSEVRRKGI